MGRHLLLLPVLLSVAVLGIARAEDEHSVGSTLASFQLADPNLIIEPVATEPNILSPVDVAWDENLRMFVCEMRDYPSESTGGTIRMLEDTDGDGTYEKATVFAEGLPFPSSCLPWRGGLLVTAAPDILYLRDTNGDGKADERRVILTGFAEGDQQLRVNGLILGLDGWVYAANGRNGGTIRRPSDPPGAAKSIARNDIRFDPDTGDFELIAGPSQFGMAFDDWGNRFLSWNTNPIRHVVIEDRDLAGCPATAGESGIANVIPPEDTGRIYPIAKLARRHNRESAEFFNATCGTTIYRGDLIPGFTGDMFVCEALESVVHHRKLARLGATFTSSRAEAGKEFLASTDSWFRPVNLETGPDGSLYVVDMCRAEIEHPDFIPKEFREGMDFRAGSDKGRIWRVRPKGGAPRAAAPPGKLDTAGLVALLGNPNGWRRDAAQRLLRVKADAHDGDAIRAIAMGEGTPESRLAALWTLAVLDRRDGGSGKWLDKVDLNRLARDPSLEFRRGVAELLKVMVMESGRTDADPVMFQQDASPAVRLQVALAYPRMGGIGSDVLFNLRVDDDPWLRLGVVAASQSAGSANFANAILEDEARGAYEQTRASRKLLEVLARAAGVERSIDLAKKLATYCACEGVSEESELALLAGYLSGLEQVGTDWNAMLKIAGVDPSQPEVADALKLLTMLPTSMAASREAEPEDIIRAIRAFAIVPPAGALPVVFNLLYHSGANSVQIKAAEFIARQLPAEEVDRLIDSGWARIPASPRRILIAGLARRKEATIVLLHAVADGRVSAMELRGVAGEALTTHADPEIRDLAKQAFTPKNAQGGRVEVVEHYRPALDRSGDAARGAGHFAKNCIACHPMQGIGQTVAPDLSGIASRVREQLLSDILNPSAEVSPDFINYIVTTKSGEVNSGLLVRESPAGVTLRQAQGLEVTIPAADLAEFRAGELSLMPEGFEDVFDQQAMADLLEFLHHGDRAMLERATRDEPLR